MIQLQEEHPITTDDQFALVVRFPDYIRATQDVAASYYANRFTESVTGIGHIRKVLDTPDLTKQLLTDHLEESHIRSWVAADAARVGVLRSITDLDATSEATLVEVADTLRRMAEVDE